jgi:hypothetical protein
MSIEHIPVTVAPSENEAIQVSTTHSEAPDLDAGRVKDPGQAEHMAYVEQRWSDTIDTMSARALHYAEIAKTAQDPSYYEARAQGARKDVADYQEMKDPTVERVGEDYRELMDIVDEIRSRAEGASTPDELEAKEKMEAALQRALRAGGVIGGPNTLLSGKYNFERLPELREASGYANRAGAAHKKAS